MSESSHPSPPSDPLREVGPLPRRELVALLRSDQRYRWCRGERIAAEAYPAGLPFLRDDAEAVLELVVGEIELREERGEPVRLDEYRTRFPELAGAITRRRTLTRAVAGSLLPATAGADGPATLPAPPKPAPPAPPTAVRRVRNWCRRHPARAGVIAVAAVCLLMGTLTANFATWASPAGSQADATDLLNRLNRERERADRAERDAAAARAGAATLQSARAEALRHLKDADDRADRATARAAEDRRSADAVFAALLDRDSAAEPLAGPLAELARAHYERLSHAKPDDPAGRRDRAQGLVGLAIIADGATADAIGHAREAVESLAASDGGDVRSDLATACRVLGRLYRRAGQLADAEAVGTRAVGLWEQLAAGGDAVARREVVRSLHELAETYVAAKQWDRGAAAYRRVVESQTGPDAAAWGQLADCLAAAGQSEPAIDARRHAIDLLRSQVGRTPEQPRPVEELGRHLTALGDALVDQDAASAAVAFVEAADAWGHAVRLRPTADARTALATAYDGLARAQHRLGQADAADRSAGLAVAVRERLVADDPDEPAFTRALAAAFMARGEWRLDRNRDDDAADDFRRALPLLVAAVNRAPDDPDGQARLAADEMNLARIDLRRHRTGPARAGYTRALARLEELSAKAPAPATVAADRGVCCINLGQLAVIDGQAGAARDWFDKAEALLKPLADHPRLKDFIAGALGDCARGRAQVGDRAGQ